jgi:hypothetical protein
MKSTTDRELFESRILFHRTRKNAIHQSIADYERKMGELLQWHEEQELLYIGKLETLPGHMGHTRNSPNGDLHEVYEDSFDDADETCRVDRRLLLTTQPDIPSVDKENVDIPNQTPTVCRSKLSEKLYAAIARSSDSIH